MVEPLDTIIEEREELMVSPTGDAKPTLRTAHFLKPSLTSINGTVPELPSPFLPSASTRLEPIKWPLKVSFWGWRSSPQRKWKTWLDRMHSSHHSTWKKVGIYEAIMGSTYEIQRDEDLLFGIAEKWCSETDSFIFPWGEATITLEDMMVLGGFSVLGDSVSIPLERELKEAEEKLIEVRLQFTRKARKACQYLWMAHFIDNESECEHDAFLSLWLSRFVFPKSSFDTVTKSVFPIAIHLARGKQIALAPAVLASIYGDLSLLKATIVASNKLRTRKEKDDVLALTLRSPFQLVQIWTWERFVTLQPVPSLLEYGEPRLARWHKVKKLKVENVRLALASAGDCFLWRPYAAAVHNWSFCNFYREKEEWVLVDSDLDEELESFARCLRVCELVGLDCVEQYFPHRVAMQFGLDQDIPECICRSNETPEIAWSDYNRPNRDTKLYIPHRLFESDVTMQYLRWWKQSLAQQDAIKAFVRRRRSSTRLPRHSKRNKEAEDSVNEDKPTLLGLLRSMDKHNNFGKTLVSDVEPSLGTQSRNISACAVSSVTAREEKLPKKPIEKIVQGEALGGTERAMEDANGNKAKRPVNNVLSINDYNGDSSSYSTIEVVGLDLEARICKLEKMVAVLKAKHCYKFEKQPREEGQSDL